LPEHATRQSAVAARLGLSRMVAGALLHGGDDGDGEVGPSNRTPFPLFFAPLDLGLGFHLIFLFDSRSMFFSSTQD
jgi:hypothetical protein